MEEFYPAKCPEITTLILVLVPVVRKVTFLWVYKMEMNVGVVILTAII